MMMFRRIEETCFRYKGSLIPSISALLYCHLAYFGGAALVLSLNPVLMGIGTVGLTHGMVIAAYLIHDCAHNALFKSPHHNALIGSQLNWLTGGCYGTYADLRAQHMRHHVDHADIIGFDYRPYLVRHPVQLRIVKALEWLYVPAVEIIMHGALVIAPFIVEEKKNQRLRTAMVITVRFSLLAVLFLYSAAAYACYLFAHVLFLTILRFMDALQHNYEIVLPSGEGGAGHEGLEGREEFGAPGRRGDRAYEHAHTFSNPVSVARPWLNLVTLNFGYHNAHHARPTAPWHALPALHNELYGGVSGEQRGNEAVFVIPFLKQLSSFHSGRVARILGDDCETKGNRFAQRLEHGRAVGATGMSFLTPV
ncbi:fatty acid desaturase [Nitrosospira sp. Nsp2]|uniref:fatty acid desaturase family protein n=1 Tax=Nitrosospira sp. Nsp2 TaxID=136548 RepID=UPI000D447367|nr:fatty acid desaturase [Nitrosospira sp. Nsp2]PTR16200.1 fatty acid desaturase [Nitrosospira sp. Nsp2]